MSPHQAVAVAVRLFAIWLAIYSARNAPGFYFQAAKYNDDAAVLFASGAVAIILLVILVMLFFPQLFAKGLLARQTDPPAGPSSPERWFDVGRSLIGLWILTDAVPGLIRYLIVAYLTKRDPAIIPLTPDWHAGAIYYVIELIIGVWLLLGGAGLKGLIIRTRYAGSK
jgi:hypothetical protein